ncbi:hypothetical protein BBJ28_00021145, partial [Nothophytophthora sp. Chile5]
MADTQTLAGDGGDLFDGLSLDYNFLDEGGDAQADAAMSSAPSAPNGGMGEFMASLTAPDDQMLLDSDVPGSSPTNMMLPTAHAEKEDLLTPLTFSFNAAGGSSGGSAYRVAAQHKHKRVRSNPDVIQGFGMANMAASVITTPVMGPSSSGLSFS